MHSVGKLSQHPQKDHCRAVSSGDWQTARESGGFGDGFLTIGSTRAPRGDVHFSS